MNTKATTPFTKDQFNKFRAYFKRRATTKQADARDHIMYNLFRGCPLARGFTPITNANKIRSDFTIRDDQMVTFTNALTKMRQALSPSQYDWLNRLNSRRVARGASARPLPFNGMFDEQERTIILEQFKMALEQETEAA